MLSPLSADAPPVPADTAPRAPAHIVPEGTMAIADRVVIALTAITAASLMIGSWTAPSNSRELLPIMVVSGSGASGDALAR